MSRPTQLNSTIAQTIAKSFPMRGNDLVERCLRSTNLGRYLSAGAWRPELRGIGAKTGVALTLDDGPTPETTPAILDLLKTYSAKATFFLSGVRACAHYDLVEAIARAGHAIYGHGWDHLHYDEGQPESLVEAVDRCETLLAGVRPTPSPYFIRLPYTAGHRSAACHRALMRWRPDIQFVHYSATFNDWLIPAQCPTKEEARARVIGSLERTPIARLAGTIVLLHEQPFDARAAEISAELSVEVTLCLIEGLLQRLRSSGLPTCELTPLATQPTWSKFVLPPRLNMLRVSPW